MVMVNKFYFSVIFLVSYTSVYSQHNLVQAGSVSMATGNASVAQINAWSAFNNPSAVCFDSISSFGMSYENRYQIKGLSRGTIALNFLSEKTAITIASSYFGSAVYYDARLGIGFNRKLDKNVSAGVQLNYLNTQIKAYGNAATVVPELSLFFKTAKKISFGIHTFNPLGAKFKENPNSQIASFISVGADYKISKFTNIYLAYSFGNYQNGSIKTGLSYQIADNMKLYLGLDSNPFLFAFGVDFMLNKKMHLQIAAQYHNYLGYQISPGFMGGF